jgi:hypothetical protein
MMGQLETGNIGIGNTPTLATFNNDRFLVPSVILCDLAIVPNGMI